MNPACEFIHYYYMQFRHDSGTEILQYTANTRLVWRHFNQDNWNRNNDTLNFVIAIVSVSNYLGCHSLKLWELGLNTNAVSNDIYKDWIWGWQIFYDMQFAIVT